MALIGPRLVLASLVHPGSLTRQGYRTMEEFPDLEQTQGSYAPEEGYQEDRGAPRAAFVRYRAPGAPRPAVTLHWGAAIPPGVVLTNRALTPIESAYLPAIKALCEKNNAALALMKLPIADSPGPIEISSQVLALGIPIVAASLESMFGDIPTERVKENYSNYIHFNANGARRSAETYGPALQALLQRTGG
jgi:hypothetical protein